MHALPVLIALAGAADLVSRPPPPLLLPPAGGTYVDPAFGSTALRVTDERDGRRCAHAYSVWRALNADATRLLVACDDAPRLYRFDGARLAVHPDGPLEGADGPSIQWEGASWSGREPDVLYALDGRRLWRVDVARRGRAGSTVVRDFQGLFGDPFELAQLSASDDDRIFTFHARDPATGGRRDVVVYDRVGDRVRIFPRGDREIDESWVDRAGRRVLVGWAGSRGGFAVWDLRTGAVDDFAWGDPDDMPGGHVDVGRELLVNGDGWRSGVLARRWTAPHGAGIRNVVRWARPDGKPTWTIAEHVSLSGDEIFAIASTYGGDGSWAPFERELVLVRLDGSGFVRLAHTRSSRDDYWAQPRAVVDRSGSFVVWTSDLGQRDRTDVLVLRIPPERRPRRASTGTVWPMLPGLAAAALFTAMLRRRHREETRGR